MRRLGPAKGARRKLRQVALTVLAVALLAAAITWFLQSAIPRRIVIATGAPEGTYHVLAQ